MFHPTLRPRSHRGVACRAAGWFQPKPDPKPLESVSAAVALAAGVIALVGAYTGIVQRFDKLETGQSALEATQKESTAAMKDYQVASTAAMKEFQATSTSAMKEFQATSTAAMKEFKADIKEDFKEFEVVVAVIVAAGYLSVVNAVKNS